MRSRTILILGVLLSLPVFARGQQDPTNPEGSPNIFRMPGVVEPLGLPVAPAAPGAIRAFAPIERRLMVESDAAFDRTTAMTAEQRQNLKSALRLDLEAQDAARDAVNADPSGNDQTEIDPNITHQPLIHVKVRVVEVQRTDSLVISSVLDFITSDGGTAPFGMPPFSQNSINDAKRRLAGITRFPVNGLIAADGSGSGMLINLTSAHINYVAALLATELHSDTITAPQVTTLNGKNVKFRAGSWVPFSLGANLIQGETNTIQEVIYRHVGTYIDITPQIVNWGKNYEGAGRKRDIYGALDPATILVRFDDIMNLPGAVRRLINDPVLSDLVQPTLRDDLKSDLFDFDRLTEQQKKVMGDKFLLAANDLIRSGKIDRARLSERIPEVARPVIQPDANDCQHCNWKPSDCTINLNLAVRLSDPGDTNTPPTQGSQFVPTTLSSEQNVRAISNMVQVKSGHGVVIGGLISMRDVAESTKVPFVGDIPVLGAAFRSKQTARIKTETLIFIEAEVLPSFECNDECGNPLVKSKTAQDFCDSKIHLQCDLCDAPLSMGMHRAGLLGEYLPPPTHAEREYWMNYEQTMHHLRHHRQMAHLRDTFE